MRKYLVQWHSTASHQYGLHAVEPKTIRLRWRQPENTSPKATPMAKKDRQSTVTEIGDGVDIQWTIHHPDNGSRMQILCATVSNHNTNKRKERKHVTEIHPQP